MIVFWIAAAVISAAAAMLMAATAADAARAGAGEDPAKSVYRRQLGEIDDLAARGLIGEAEAKSARAETGRRLLRSAEPAAQATARPSSPRTMLAITAIPPLLAVGAYLLFGAPGLPDQPFDRRVAGWMTNPSTLDPPRMAAILRFGLRDHPNDLILLRNLATFSLRSGDAPGAVQAMRRAVALSPRDPALWVALGEALLVQNEGRLDDSSRQAFAEALRLRPGDPETRYALARGQIAGGDLAGGIAAWRALAAELPAGDPRRASLLAEAEQVTRWGALQPPQAAAAAPSSPAANPAIVAMVAGLAQRLAANPDDPQGWVRLVRAYQVLGDIPRRDAALAQARARYRNDPAILQALDEALRSPVL